LFLFLFLIRSLLLLRQTHALTLEHMQKGLKKEKNKEKKKGLFFSFFKLTLSRLSTCRRVCVM